MKTLVAVIITALITSTGAYAGTTWSRSSKGIVCQTISTGVACIRQDAAGYGVGISEDFVFVMNAQGKRVFLRWQP